MRFLAFFFIIIIGGIFIPLFFLSANEEEKIFSNLQKPTSITLIINGSSEKIDGSALNEWFDTSSSLYHQKENPSEIFNTAFCHYAKYYCDFILPLRKSNYVSLKNRETLKEDKIKMFLEDLARRTNKDPIDAKFQMEEGRVVVFSLSEDGRQLEIEKSLQTIKNQLENFSYLTNKPQNLEINLVTRQIKPEISSNEVDNLGITNLIGEGKSNFRGSPKNRIHNINVAAKRFNGVLIKPEEEFSFVKILGEVDGEHGYLPELVIKHDKTEPEFGGGICQVSTTAFRAAIYSGLKITARRNHAYPVAYYNPQGMDATVYVPRPDLRFLNNTPGYILIQTKIEGTELIFQFYGTSDGRKVEIDGPKVLERNSDGSMKTTFTQRVLDKNGQEMFKDIFISFYDSPSKYPHPGQEEILKEKPKNWSDHEWKEYKKIHRL